MTVPALVQYQYLNAQADELERMASADPPGGPSYWGDRVESTRQALANGQWQPDPQAIGNTWALPLESVEAVHDALTQELMDALWRGAAALLRARARRLQVELQAEGDRIRQTLEAIDKANAEHPIKPSAGGDS